MSPKTRAPFSASSFRCLWKPVHMPSGSIIFSVPKLSSSSRPQPFCIGENLQTSILHVSSLLEIFEYISPLKLNSRVHIRSNSAGSEQMSSVHALFPDNQAPTKRSRADAELTRSAETELTHFSASSESGSSDAMESNASRVSHGSVSLIGRRRVMEDAITVAPPGLPGALEFFAVYDGQGGPRVSMACHERLHMILAEEITQEGAQLGVDWTRVMKAGFNKMDDEVKGLVGGNGYLVEDGSDGADGSVAVETTGSTATVVMMGEEEIVVANCGDSRAVLFSGVAALPLSHDHKPEAPEERTRLEPGEPHLDLPVSRAIGHHGHVAKRYLISDPEVRVHGRTQSDKFLIVATHGLWDVVSNEDACSVVSHCLDGQIRRSFEEDSVTSPDVAATTLAELAMARGSKHNISLVVIEL